MAEKSNLKSLEQFVEEQYGPKGTSKRDSWKRVIRSSSWVP